MKIKTLFIAINLIIINAVFNSIGNSMQNQIIRFKQEKFVLVSDTNLNNYFIHKGKPMGYQMEIAKIFTNYSNSKLDLRFEDLDQALDKLESGEVHAVVYSHGAVELRKLLQLRPNIMSSAFVDSKSKTVWLVSKNRIDIIKALHFWLSGFQKTESYNKLQSKYFEMEYNKSSSISMFDDLIKQHAVKIGWDWRLVAALVYHESTFRPTAKSHVGATGLMQLMPATAREFGGKNMRSPEDNIKTGTSYLAYLEEQVIKDSIPQEEVVNFVLASYNAGNGRVKDCRLFSQMKGFDSGKWEDVAKAVSLMRNMSAEDRKKLRFGTFNGEETVNYVRNINDTYTHYSQLFKE